MIQAKNVHIIGIGGIGTSAVAKWWQQKGAIVSGSDMHPSEITEDLSKRGVQVKIGHSADNMPPGVDLMIYSRAVPEENTERVEATNRELTQWSFPEFLGEMAKDYKTIAVSGTNGKSTTTAMIATILEKAGYDPTVIIGTKVPGWELGNLRIGDGGWLVVEACEHMASMLHIKPNTIVITNIEEDHLDYYRDIDHIRETFQEWVDCSDTCSQVVLNRDDAESQKLQTKYASNFGVDDRRVEKGVQRFDVAGVEVELQLPGAFNAENAAAALTAAHHIGVKDDDALEALKEFKGTWRRFEHVGIWKGADVYSDYAHHPTACQGSIAAFKEFYPDRRLVVVFEPHQHSRTHELFDEFVSAFDGADVLIVSEVYEVTGRTEEKFESSKDLAGAIKKRGKVGEVLYAENLDAAEDHVRDAIEKDDVLVVMGAGNVDALARKLV